MVLSLQFLNFQTPDLSTSSLLRDLAPDCAVLLLLKEIFQRQIFGRGEFRIVFKYILYHCSGRFNEWAVFHDIGEFEIEHSALPRSLYITGTAQFKILFCNFKSVTRGCHDIDAVARIIT